MVFTRLCDKAEKRNLATLLQKIIVNLSEKIVISVQNDKLYSCFIGQAEQHIRKIEANTEFDQASHMHFEGYGAFLIK